jgi:hypothetical protein
MLRRYVALALVVMAGAVVIGLVSYSRSSTSFSATCSLEVNLPLTRQTIGSDYFAASKQLATTSVADSLNGRLYAQVAGQTGVDPATVSAALHVGTGGGNAVLVTATTDQRDLAPRIANAACNQLVTAVKTSLDRRQTDQASLIADRIANLQSEIAQIQAVDTASRTPAQSATLATDQLAVKGLQQELANTIALPPNLVDLVSTAGFAIEGDSRSLSRNLVVAVVAGLLASFLAILLSEMVLERRGRRPF